MTQLAQAITGALVQFVWQGFLIAFLLSALLFVLRKHQPQVRYLVCCAGLAVLAILPVITTAALYDPLPSNTLPAITLTIQGIWKGSGQTTARWFDGLSAFQPWILRIWVAGVFILSLRLAWLGGTVSSLRRSGTPADAAIVDSALRLARRVGLTRTVRILVSSIPDGPAVAGWLKPVILIPAVTILNLTPDELEAVLAHEIAHLRRYDDIVNIAQSVVETVLFYHPAVWWISNRIRHEREFCADDLAVQACGNAMCYAGALATLEKLRIGTPVLALRATDAPLLHRIRRIVGARTQEYLPSGLPGALALGMALACFAIYSSPAHGTAQPRTRVEYPESARSSGIQGTIPVEVTVDATGHVNGAKALGGPRELRGAAVESASALHFTPEAALATKQVNVAFQLNAVTPPPSPAATSHLASVSGRVVNATTGEPLRKVDISLLGPPRRLLDTTGQASTPSVTYTTTTDSDGRFTASVEPGVYTARAAHTGFVDYYYDTSPQWPSGFAFQVTAGQAKNVIDFKLTPAATVSGRVTDPDGDSVAGSPVQLSLDFYYTATGQKVPAMVRGAMTDDLGEFRLSGLAPGKYYLRAVPMRPLPQSGVELKDGSARPQARVMVPTLYPSAAGLKDAKTIQVASGDDLRGINLKLADSPAFRIRGRVTNFASFPAGAITVHLSTIPDVSPLITPKTVTPGPDGQFEFTGVPPASYVLLAGTEIGKRPAYASLKPIRISSESINDVELEVKPTLDVQGVVKFESGSGDGDPKAVAMYLYQSVRAAFPTPVPEAAKPGSDGAFAFHDVFPDKFIMSVNPGSTRYYVKSITMGDSDVWENGLDLSGGVTAPLQVTLAAKPGELRGTVKDEKGTVVSGGTVVLVPAATNRQGQARWYRTVRTGPDGKFAMTIIPGDYIAYSWPVVPTGAWINADFMRPFEAKGRLLSIKPGDSLTEDLTALEESAQ